MAQKTNADFAATDLAFRAACEKVNVKPTKRQASKWRNRKGQAYKEGRSHE